MKRLYVHIGTGKTGTTSIQSFLYWNRDRLNERGFNYARSGLRNIQHHPLCLNHPSARDGERPSAALLDAWEHLRIEMEASDVPNHVISSEYFPGIPQDEISRISEMMAGVAEVHMVAYFRRQDFYLESWYAQLIKTGRIGSDLRQLRRRLDANGTLNFFDHTVKWADVVGDDCVHVRPYEKRSFKEGVLLVDFLDLLGCTFPDDLKAEASDVFSNPSLTRPQIKVVKALNSLGLAGELGKKLTRPHSLFSGCDKNFLSVDERLALLEEYAESNAQLARRFLGREDGRLFADTTVDFPRSDPDPDTVLAFLRDVLEVSDATARGGDQHDIGG